MIISRRLSGYSLEGPKDQLACIGFSFWSWRLTFVYWSLRLEDFTFWTPFGFRPYQFEDGAA